MKKNNLIKNIIIFSIFGILMILLNSIVIKKIIKKELIEIKKQSKVIDLEAFYSDQKEKEIQFEEVIQLSKMNEHLIHDKNIKEHPYLRKWFLQNYFIMNTDIVNRVNLLTLPDHVKIPSIEDIKALPHMKIAVYSEQEIKNKKLFENFLKAYVNQQKIYKIPHIHHRVWITGDDNPNEVPRSQVQKFIKSLDVFDKDWHHIFWCLDPCKIPNTIKIIKDSKKNIEIRSIKEIVSTMPGKYLFNRLVEEKYYVAAADIIKRFIVYKIGGLYCDMGILWKKDPSIFIDTFDRIVNLSPVTLPDFGMFAHAAGSPVEEKFFKILEEFPNLSKAIKEKFNGFNILALTWSFTFKILLDNEIEDDKKVFYWDQEETYYREWEHKGAWISGSLGNKKLTESTVVW